MKSTISNNRPIVHTGTKHRSQHGVSLIELMIAITIGLVLVYGATALYVKSKVTYNDNDMIARLQESGRYALGSLEHDVLAANYWGQFAIQNSYTSVITVTSQPPDIGGPGIIASGTDDCGPNFAFDVRHSIQGDNGGTLPFQYGGGATGFLNANSSGNCVAKNQVAASDTLTLRHADPNSAATTDYFKVCSSVSTADIVKDATSCSPSDQVNGYQVHSYYISQDSDRNTGLPSLRRKYLNSAGNVQDEEIISGVEDMQIQFGIEVTSNVKNTPLTGVVTQYVDPDAKVIEQTAPAAAQIVSVRVSLLLRGETLESSFEDSRAWEYGSRNQSNGTTGDLNSLADANKAYAPASSSDSNAKHYRRVVVTRTFMIRNVVK